MEELTWQWHFLENTYQISYTCKGEDQTNLPSRFVNPRIWSFYWRHNIPALASVSFSPNGKLLTSGSKDKTVRI